MQEEKDGYGITTSIVIIGDYYWPCAMFKKTDAAGGEVRFFRHFGLTPGYRTEDEAKKAIKDTNVASISDDQVVEFVSARSGGDLVNNG